MRKDSLSSAIDNASQRYLFVFGCVVIGFLVLIFFEFQNPPISGTSENNPLIEIRKFYVVEVIDGDTITVQDDIFVRLIGIDAPEKNKPCYEESKKALENLVLNKYVILSQDKNNRDKYGRLLRYVLIDNQNTSIKMARNGFAVAMPVAPDLKYAKEIKEAVSEAKQEKIGCLNYSK